MIRLKRSDTPGVLLRLGDGWTERFLASPDRRPPSRQYRHPEIVDALRACSHGKCFYCELAVPSREGEVDHYVEIAVDRALAFQWTNLYWACRGCNDKVRSVPLVACLDPFDPDVDPVDHLIYDDEQIRARNGSTRGLRTIDRYKLNREGLQLARSRVLRNLFAFVLELERETDARKKADLTELVRSFAAPDRPFSAMCGPVVRALLHDPPGAP